MSPIPISGTASLGSYCQSACWLRNNNLGSIKGPFDYTFSSPEIVHKILADNFSALTDLGNFTKVKEGRSSHSHYDPTSFFQTEKATDTKYHMFHHHDITQPKAASNLMDRVARMRDFLNKPCTEFGVGGARLFMMMIRNQTGKLSDELRQQIDQLNHTISTFFDKGQYEFLVVYHIRNDSVVRASCNVEQSRGRHLTYLFLTTTKPTDGKKFTNPQEEQHFTTCVQTVYQFVHSVTRVSSKSNSVFNFSEP